MKELDPVKYEVLVGRLRSLLEEGRTAITMVSVYAMRLVCIARDHIEVTITIDIPKGNSLCVVPDRLNCVVVQGYLLLNWCRTSLGKTTFRKEVQLELTIRNGYNIGCVLCL